MGRRRCKTQRLPSPVVVAGIARREFARRRQKALLPPPLPDLLPSAAKVARPRTRRQEAVGNPSAVCVASSRASSFVILSSFDIGISDFSHNPSCPLIQRL